MEAQNLPEFQDWALLFCPEQNTEAQVISSKCRLQYPARNVKNTELPCPGVVVEKFPLEQKLLLQETNIK
jgi:hypothetical protein